MTYLRYGGIFKYQSVANFVLSMSVKKFENRLTFGYGQEFSVLFFIDSRCRSAPFVSLTFFLLLSTAYTPNLYKINDSSHLIKS